MVYYVALPFTQVDGGLAPGEAVECPHGAAAIRRAEALSRELRYAGPSRSPVGDPDLGEYQDAVILGCFGEVPEEIILRK